MRLPTTTRLLVAVTWLFWLAPAARSAEPAPELKPDNPFFAFDNGTGRGELPLDAQAQLLADLGYDGIGYTGTQQIPEMLAALDKFGLKMFSTYVGATVAPDGPTFDSGMKQAVADLKGRDTILWLYIRGNAPDAQQQAVQITRQVAELAAESDLRVALYPHFGFYVDRVEAALRIAQQAQRANVGVSFNLCHFLRVGDGPNLDQRLRETLPQLMLVSINGADHEGDWDRLIQPLDRGDYDVHALLKKLRGLGYRGPIGLQCYAVPGDRRENLQRSMAAWRGIQERLAGEARSGR